MKYAIPAFALIATAFAGAASAQGRLVEVDDRVMVERFGRIVDRVDDLNVYSSAGVRIGEVEEVLGQSRRRASALVIDFSGRNGYPNRDVVIPLNRFTLSQGRLLLDASRGEISRMPRWDD